MEYRILKRWGIYYVQSKWLLFWHTVQMQMMNGTHDIEFDSETEARQWIKRQRRWDADKGTIIAV